MNLSNFGKALATSPVYAGQLKTNSTETSLDVRSPHCRQAGRSPPMQRRETGTCVEAGRVKLRPLSWSW